MSRGLIKAPASTCVIDRFDHSMNWRGPITDIISVEVTHDWWDTPTGTLVIPSGGKHAEAIRRAAPLPSVVVNGQRQPATLGDVIPIDVTVNGLRWSGRVDGWTEEKVDGAWQITVGLIHEAEFLGNLLCFPAPGSNINIQFPQQDFDYGPAAVLVERYLRENLVRVYGSEAASPWVICPSPPEVTTEPFQLAARMTYPRDLFKEMLRVAERSISVTRWRVGDPQPRGLNLTSPKVVIEVVAGRTRDYVVWDEADGGLQSPKLTGVAPRVTKVVTGGKAPDLVNSALQNIFAGLNFFDNVFGAFNVFENAELRAALGPFAWPEQFVNAGSGAFTIEAFQAGRVGLRNNAGSFAATGVVVDGTPWRLNEDYRNGDFVWIKVLGVEYPQQIRSITVGRTRDSGVYARPVLGDKPSTEDPFDKALRQVQSLITWVTAMNLGA